MIFVIQPDLFQWLYWHVHIVELSRNTYMKIAGGRYMVGGRGGEVLCSKSNSNNFILKTGYQ